MSGRHRFFLITTNHKVQLKLMEVSLLVFFNMYFVMNQIKRRPNPDLMMAMEEESTSSHSN